jgi:hypothetical protein
VLTVNGVRIGDASVSLKDAPPPPPPPALDYFNPNTDSIEIGKSVTLNWRVSNASSVTINNQQVKPQGSQSFTPSSVGTATYTIAANGIAFDQKITVNVVAPPPPQPKQEAIQQAPPVAALPEASVLQPLLAPFNGTLNSALPLKDKDCKAKAAGVFSGALKDLAENWCGTAQSISISENDCHVGGTPDAPVMRCTVAIGIIMKSGPPSNSAPAKSFHFTKNGDSYTLTSVTGR